MTISVWRYSHLALAISSFLFVLLASVTGLILAFEPVSKALMPYSIHGLNEVYLSETLDVLGREYDEVFKLTIDKNQFVELDAINKTGKSVKGYIDPKTGQFLGKPIVKSKLFRVTTNLHRSLFLKSTGRILVGIASFLLFLISISGLILIVKRQLKVKRFFSRVIKDNFSQYWHTILGRLFLIPIILITLTGVYLSLFRFNVLPQGKTQAIIKSEMLKQTPKLDVIAFKGIQDIQLKDVVSVDFPFSKDVEDFYTVKLTNKTLKINQFTGEVVTEVSKLDVVSLADWSLQIHTGKGSLLWSIVLGISCVVILFFMVSGFKMTINRRKKTSRIKATSHKDKAEYILLVGSETGHTYQFATLFYKALIKAGKSVFMTDLNAYSTFKNAKHLVVFTSTYGDGDAPVNAKKFLTQFSKHKSHDKRNYAVLGFGSKAYTHYCKYAEDIDFLLKRETIWKETIKLGKINNQSFVEFKTWVNQWSKATEVPLDINPLKLSINSKRQNQFKVVSFTPINADSTFLLRLKPKQNIRFKSGDLIAFRPKEDQVERLYSIGKIENDILLSIKKHEFGLCSTYLWSQQVNDKLNGELKKHASFHFPKRAKEVVLISNGTGIAPFLGMINENKKRVKTHLFWGGRTEASLELYKSLIQNNLSQKQLYGFYTAYSQEQINKVYIQDILLEQSECIAQAIRNKGVIMICGSVAMQKQVLLVLDRILQAHLQVSVKALERKGRIKSDCY